MWPESSSVNIVNLVKKNLLQFRRYRIFPRGLFFLLAHPVERCPCPLDKAHVSLLIAFMHEHPQWHWSVGTCSV